MPLLAAPAQSFTDSTPIRADAAQLQARAKEEGYLFFPGLLAPQAVQNVRSDFRAMLVELGWLKAGTNPDDLIAGRPAVIESLSPEFPQLLNRFQRFETFHALGHQPAIFDVLDKLFGEPALLHPRNIGRVMFPDTPTTPPHQDYFHIRGTPDTWTIWIPLVDCPRELGGLAILPGSHTRGILPTRHMPGAGGSGIDLADPDSAWRTVDYKTGDVLMLHSHTVHTSTPNQTGTRMRLSVDFRYQPISHPIEAGSLKPHHNKFGWDYVYANWRPESAPLQFYWKRLPLNVVNQGKPQAGY